MSAPLHRSVCQLTGDISRPSKFWEGLASSDARLVEFERLQVENERLRVENADMATHVADLRDALEDRNTQLRRMFVRVGTLVAQRDRAAADAVTAAAALSAVRGAR